MKRTTAKLIPAVAVLGVIAAPTAVATASAQPAAARAAVAAPHGQTTLNTLKKEIIALNKRIAVLEHRGVKQPTTAKPVGPAGGSLTGTYPNPLIATSAVGRPQIANDAIGSPQISDGSVFSTDLADGAVTQTKLAPNSVTSAALIDGSVGNADLANGVIDQNKLGVRSVGDINLMQGSVDRIAIAPGAVDGEALTHALPVTDGQGDAISPGQTKAVTVTCPQGHRILSGGFEWTATTHDGASVISSGPAFNGDPNTQWAVQARVDSGGQANTLIVEALCL